MTDELGSGTLYTGVKCPRAQDTVATASCPLGLDKPGLDILLRGKVSPGTRYHAVFCPWGQATGGQDKPVNRGLYFLMIF